MFLRLYHRTKVPIGKNLSLRRLVYLSTRNQHRRRFRALQIPPAIPLVESYIQKRRESCAAKDEMVPPGVGRLVLPSQFSTGVRLWKDLGSLATIEQNLRFGMAADVLRELRRVLHSTSALLHFKTDRLSGQTQNTSMDLRQATLQF